MYKNGKLTKTAREKLERKYAKERKKDSILAKIDAKTKRKPTKKTVKTLNKVQKNIPTKPTTPQPKKRAPKAQAQIPDDVSECPSTPPRNDMVKEREAIMKQNEGVNWITLVNDVEHTAKAEEYLYRKMERKYQSDYKTSLEKQIAVRAKQRGAEEAARKAEQQGMRNQFAEWDAEEGEKALRLHEKTEKLKKMREEQIGELEVARERFRKKELRRDKRTAEKAKAETQAHEQGILDKKRKHVADMKKVLEENAAQKEILLAEKAKQAEDDIRLQEVYAKMLQDQEESRKKRLAKTYAQADQKAAKLTDFTKLEREKQEAEDRKTEAELLKRQAESDAREQAKRDRLKKEALEIQDYLRMQINQKEDRLREEIESDIAYGAFVKTQVQKGSEAEVAKVESRRKRLYDQADYIRNQIKQNEELRLLERADMSAEERNMNQKLIEKIEAGPQELAEPSVRPSRPFEWRYKCRSKPF